MILLAAAEEHALRTWNLHVCKLIGKTQSLMCTKKKDGTVIVEVPNKQVKEFYKELKVKVPSSVSLETFKTETLKLKANRS